jgi:cytochrome c
MDTFELNKIAGAILGSLLAILGINKLMGAIYSAPEEGAAPAYVVEGVEAEAAEPAGEAAPAKSFAELLAEATPEQGKRVSAKCASCHTFEQGGADKTGPNLWGVIDGPLAHKEGYNYSPAFQSARAKGEKWSDERLAQYLENPQKFMPGTKMSFVGLKKPQERANMLAYLHQQSNVPLKAGPEPSTPQ